MFWSDSSWYILTLGPLRSITAPVLHVGLLLIDPVVRCRPLEQGSGVLPAVQAGREPALGAQPGDGEVGSTLCTVVGWLWLSQEGSERHSWWPTKVTVDVLLAAFPQPTEDFEAAEFVLALLTLAWPRWWCLLSVCLLTCRHRHGHSSCQCWGFVGMRGNHKCLYCILGASLELLPFELYFFCRLWQNRA